MTGRRLAQGFFRTVCGLVGLFMGRCLAAWNYGFVAQIVLPLVHFRADRRRRGAFITSRRLLCVDAAASVIGKALHKAAHSIGVGCLDRIGAEPSACCKAFCCDAWHAVTVAFFPSTGWLTQARLPKTFFGACHFPRASAPRIWLKGCGQGSGRLNSKPPLWMHSEMRNAVNSDPRTTQ